MRHPDYIVLRLEAVDSGLWLSGTHPLCREWTSESRAEAERTEDCRASPEPSVELVTQRCVK